MFQTYARLISTNWPVVISALELTSRNILCGSVRMVYAIIYTLFLVGLERFTLPFSDYRIRLAQGFGLAIGSDIYLVIDPRARRALEKSQTPTYRMLHGTFQAENGTSLLGEGVFGFAKAASLDKNYLLRGTVAPNCVCIPRCPTLSPRLSQRTGLAVVATTSSVVAIARPGPNLRSCFITSKHAETLELAASGDGHPRMCGVHRQQAG